MKDKDMTFLLLGCPIFTVYFLILIGEDKEEKEEGKKLTICIQMLTHVLR